MVHKNENLAAYVARMVTNIIPKAPNTDKPITYNDQVFGRPLFRIKPSNNIAGEVYFEKQGEKMFLKMVLQAYREQANEIPLDLMALQIGLEFSPTEQKTTVLPLNITTISPGKTPNILMDIAAVVEITNADHLIPLYYGLVNPGEQSARIIIQYKIDWAKPLPKLTKGAPANLLAALPPPVAFDYKTLQANKKELTLPNGLVLATFKNGRTTKLALKTIKHLKLDTRYRLPSGIGQMGFDLYLSKGSIPVIDTLFHVLQPNDKQIGEFSNGNFQATKVTDYAKPKFGFTTFPSFFDTDTNKTQITSLKKILLAANANHVLHWGASTQLQNYANLINEAPFQLFGRVVNNDNLPITVNKDIKLNIHPNNQAVFNHYFNDLKPEYIWEKAVLDKGGKQFTINYRPSTNPDEYYFLPQTYRLGLNDKGMPDLKIFLFREDTHEIAVECRVLPYTHPKAKKDLIEKVQSIRGIKYIKQITFGGYDAIIFKPDAGLDILNKIDIYADGVLVSGNSEGIEVPANGFTLKFVTDIEGFSLIKQSIFELGKIVGKIHFKLQNETKTGTEIVSGEPIDVEIALTKPANITLAMDIENIKTGKTIKPQSLQLSNPYPYPISVKGIDFMLLAKSGENVVQVSSDLAVDKSFPVSLPNDNSNVQFNVVPDSFETTIPWTDLLAVPYGLYYDTNAPKIMSSFIDLTSNENVGWDLEVEFYGNWTDDLHAISVVLADLDGNQLDTVRLENKTDETGKLMTRRIAKMATTLKHLLDTATGFNKSYQYKRIYYFKNGQPPVEEAEWQQSTDSQTEHLLFNNILE